MSNSGVKVIRNGSRVEFAFDLPKGASVFDLAVILADAIEARKPSQPDPGQVTRNGFASACLGPHVPWEESAQVAWAAAEAAAREGYVSKAEIRKALEEFNPYGAETVDVLGVVDEIRELVK